MGVRYVVLPSTQGTGGGAKAPPSRARSAPRSTAQLDLARLRSEPGFVLYENLAWIPLQAAVPATQPAMCRSARPTRSAPRSVSSSPRNRWGRRRSHRARCCGARPSTRTGRRRRRGRPATRRDVRMVERIPGHEDGHRRDRVHGPVATLGVPRRLARDLALRDLALASHARAQASPSRAEAARDRRERRSRPDPLAEVLDEDAFWWERV